MGWDVCWHELGHSQLTSMYAGEGEALNNLLYTYIENTEFGVDFDEAFAYSRGHDRKTVDQAALDWMVTPNFRDGNRMDNSNTEFDEFRYQHRGCVTTLPHPSYRESARGHCWVAVLRPPPSYNPH